MNTCYSNNCKDSCNDFFKNKSNDTLGDIKNDGTCANCLYWKYGPPSFIYDSNFLNNCECGNLLQEVSKNKNGISGTNFDINGYNEVNECLKKSKNCGYLPSTFSNNPEKCKITNYTEMKPCNKKKSRYEKLQYDGVF